MLEAVDQFFFKIRFFFYLCNVDYSLPQNGLFSCWFQLNSHLSNFSELYFSQFSFPAGKKNIKFDMYLKVQQPWNVIIPAEKLEAKGLMLQREIIIKLMDDFSEKKATKDLGYFLAVTTLDNIGEGIVRQHTGDVLFPVLFSAITFKLHQGEVIEGVVHKILKHGVFLRCGPLENLYLSHQKMPDYKYVPGENPIFMNEKSSKIEKDVVMRVIVIGTKYIEAEKDFQAVVSLEGDYLGPVA